MIFQWHILMAVKSTFPKSRIEFARMKENNYFILKTLDYLKQKFELDIDKKKSLESALFRIRDRVNKAKKSLDYFRENGGNLTFPWNQW